ncbi:hypothetical protein P9126_13355 [Bacillus glycinifermentans]|nr:hypothetical protein [Bacillus glycinifermentans]MEC3607977.1 hypothetical protein [Bacillus glycinifermentans]
MVEKEARTETREDFIAYHVDAAGIVAPIRDARKKFRSTLYFYLI